MIFERTKEVEKQYEKDLYNYKGDCIFCDRSLFIKRNEYLDEFEYFYIIKNRYPYRDATKHIVIVARRHFSDIGKMTEKEKKEFLEIIYKYNCLGLRILVNGVSNATIPCHFHFQALTDK